MTKLTREEAEWRIQTVLSAAGITMDLFNGGAREEPWADVKFPDGTDYYGEMTIYCDGLSYQRG